MLRTLEWKDGLETMGKEVVMAYFKTLSPYMSSENEGSRQILVRKTHPPPERELTCIQYCRKRNRNAIEDCDVWSRERNTRRNIPDSKEFQ
jgi:hypothetical protein